MTTTIADVFGWLSGIVWGPYLLIPLLLATGVYLTIRLGGIQFVRLGAALNLGLLRRKDPGSAGDITQYQALSMTIAATVGTGNIVGVAMAISVGGPGALFWMWVTGLLGMASKYSEAFLGVRFRTVDARGERNGGPQHYLQQAIKGRGGAILAWLFTIFTIFASLGIGNMVQGNAVASNLESTFSVPAALTAIVLTVFVFVVLVGGVTSIGRFTAGLVPLMIVLYVAAALYILLANIVDVPSALAMILTEAFTGGAATGGFLGSAVIIAVQMGVARGIFSNEAGMGSGAIAAAAAQTSHPVRQGLVAMTQTFIDTIIVVSMTGLVVITTGAYAAVDDSGEQISAELMTGRAFGHGLPGEWGQWLVTISLVLFAGSTLLAWSYNGERAIERAFGSRIVMPFRVFWTVIVFIGATTELEVVWNFSDLMNGLMALPNLIGLLLLSGLVARETQTYLRFDPKLTATAEQIEAAFAGDPSYRQWRQGDERVL